MDLRTLLRTGRVMAIVRGRDADASLRTVLALVAEGIKIVEVSLTSHRAFDVLAQARAELGSGAALGAGTVLTTDDTRRAVEAGASFIVTPGLGKGLDEACRLELPVLAGALTPTEVAAAVSRGASAVKLFPASLGGVDYLRALRSPFPQVPLVPVGGVDANSARDFLEAGALAVGVGAPLVGDAADGGDLGELRARARALLASVQS
ncbi:bifunctional 4-hydroxy-2-oxoglutarate aldolase/2-dehydro-3-deoxy-phosphogluconate aldolase [Streptomyces tubercidicus]|uniref:bifunctional 4-hydroxy-2-oxoglutarate aldolase/2-dehydro-3-deoxy-phosphogluconate aldolase n=1 Tax=Streptomyces tubercidicus TaxID=47759 RepID=UPI0034669A0C